MDAVNIWVILIFVSLLEWVKRKATYFQVDGYGLACCPSERGPLTCGLLEQVVRLHSPQNYILLVMLAILGLPLKPILECSKGWQVYFLQIPLGR